MRLVKRQQTLQYYQPQAAKVEIEDLKFNINLIFIFDEVDYLKIRLNYITSSEVHNLVTLFLDKPFRNIRAATQSPFLYL